MVIGYGVGLESKERDGAELIEVHRLFQRIDPGNRGGKSLVDRTLEDVMGKCAVAVQIGLGFDGGRLSVARILVLVAVPAVE